MIRRNFLSVVISGLTILALPIKTIIKNKDFVFTGEYSFDWHDSRNWNLKKVPVEGCNVTFPDGVYCEIIGCTPFVDCFTVSGDIDATLNNVIMIGDRKRMAQRKPYLIKKYGFSTFNVTNLDTSSWDIVDI